MKREGNLPRELKVPHSIRTDSDINKVGYTAIPSSVYKQVPEEIKKRGVVLNLDKPSGSGTHWVAIKKMDSGRYKYYDSFGFRMPYGTGVRNSLVTYNANQDQRFGEANCGNRSVKWLREN